MTVAATLFRVHFVASSDAPATPLVVTAADARAARQEATKLRPGEIITKIKRDRAGGSA